MKTNFKKLAISAGVTAVLAAGSMSAHAVITAVPAPAQLVPLFYYNAQIETQVRVIVPKSVGYDTVINILSGRDAVPPGIQPNPSWSTTSPGLIPTPPGGFPQNLVHWYWLNSQSAEIVNATIPVSPDDEVWIAARALGVATGVAANTTGYLLLGNETADTGGAPTFQIAADAWLSNNSTFLNGLPSSISIPVLGLADAADTRTYPTPDNNLIQNYSIVPGATGPIASPIHTGVRTSTTMPGQLYRVVDVPVFDSTTFSNTLVAWADSNGAANGLSGRLYGVDGNEFQSSLGTFSFPRQLNIVSLGVPAPAGIGLGLTPTSAVPILGAGVGAPPPATPGFLKLVMNTKPLPAPVATLAPGAYSSAVLFTIPAELAPFVGAQEATEIATDTGFFSAN